MYAARDPLPVLPRRILVAGITGVGKSTLAQRLSAELALPYTEIDALYHGPNWTPRESFLAEVDAMVRQDAWVTEWQYRSARERLADGADTLVWLDYPVVLSLRRLVLRTIRRRLGRQELWSGNLEPPLWHLFTGRDHVLVWAMSTHRKYKQSVPALARTHPHLQIVRLGGQRDVETWLSQLASRRG